MTQPIAAQQSTSSGLLFEAVDQNMWGTGSAFDLSFNHFLGTTWDASASLGGIIGSANEVIIPSICDPTGILGCSDAVTADTRTGLQIQAETNGRLGVDLNARLSAGDVDVSYGGQASVAIGTTAITPGETFTISSSFLPSASTAFLNTEFPSFEAWMDLVFDVEASGSHTECLIGFGCNTHDFTLFDVDETLGLASINRDGDGVIKVLGQELPGYNFGEPVAVGPVDVTAYLPNLNTTGGLVGSDLVSSGGMDVLSLGVDVPNLVANAILPGSGYLLSGDVCCGIGYSVFESSLGPTLGLAQSFLFDATPRVRLDFNAPVQLMVGGILQTAVSSLDFRLGESIEILAPIGTGPQLEITPFYYLQNLFTVETDLTARLDLSLDVLGLQTPLGDLGPVLTRDISSQALSFNVDTRSFAMNFNTMQGAAMVVSTTVPEPASIFLITSGLLGVAAARRRRRHLRTAQASCGSATL